MSAFSENPVPGTIIKGIIYLFLSLFVISLISTAPVLNLAGLSKINAPVLFISRILYWIIILLLWVYCKKIEQQDLLLWKERKYNFATYLLSIVALLLILLAGSAVIKIIYTLSGLSSSSNKLSELSIILQEHKILALFTALTAGIVEEFIFRGYLQPRLQVLFKNPYNAILISSLLFGLLHYRYGTIINVIVPVFIGFIFALYYWKYRNIKVLMICHFLWDAMALLTLFKTSH